MGRVDGKVALVAGAGGGIGGTGAEALAREGAAVACTDIDGAATETIAARICAAGGRPKGIARAGAQPPFQQPPRRHNGCVQGVQGLGRCGESAVAQINYNLLGRF
jgi:NAD(P)-dependent dehydrogenase (short-subunit alcohol dehydrogenase family)